MGKGSSKTTSTNEPPGYVQDAQQRYIALAQDMAAPFLDTPPTQRVAGLHADQLSGFDQARTLSSMTPDARFGVMAPGAAHTMDLSQHWLDPAPHMMAGAPRIDPTVATMQAPVINPLGTQLGAAPQVGLPLSAEAPVEAYMNPYTEQVIARSLTGIERSRSRAMNELDARRAATGAFGNRAELARSDLGERYDRQMAETEALLRQHAFQDAQSRIQADLNRGLQGQLANQGAVMQTGLANQNAYARAVDGNAARRLQAGLSNQGVMAGFLDGNAAREMQANLANQQMGGALDMANQQMRGTMDMANMNALNQRAVFDSQLRQAAYDQAMAGANTLMAMGGLQQSHAQQQLDVPLEMLNLLMQTTSAVPNVQTSTQKTSQGLGSVLGPLGTFVSTVSSLPS